MPKEEKTQENTEQKEEVTVEIEKEEEKPKKSQLSLNLQNSTEQKATKPEKEEASGDELENYSEGVQKRISKLTAKMREAERREQAALDYAKSIQKQLEETNKRTNTLDNSFVNEFENRVTIQEKALRTQLKEAIDRGDVDAQVEAQTSLAKLAQDNQRLSYIKSQKEEQAKQVKEVAQQKPAQPQPQAVPDEKAQRWAQKNTWFGQDEPMTLTAFSIHKQLVEQEGFDAKTDEYYEEIDKRLRNEFPNKFEGGKTTRSSPTVASASRGNGGLRSNSKSVKLTQSEVAIAKKLGITNEQYAKAKLQKAQQTI